MAMRKSRLGKEKQLRLIEHFVAGTTVRCAADLVGVNIKTAAYYFHRLRGIITEETNNEEKEKQKEKGSGLAFCSFSV